MEGNCTKNAAQNCWLRIENSSRNMTHWTFIISNESDEVHWFPSVKKKVFICLFQLHNMQGTVQAANTRTQTRPHLQPTVMTPTHPATQMGAAKQRPVRSKAPPAPTLQAAPTALPRKEAAAKMMIRSRQRTKNPKRLLTGVTRARTLSSRGRKWTWRWSRPACRAPSLPCLWASPSPSSSWFLWPAGCEMCAVDYEKAGHFTPMRLITSSTGCICRLCEHSPRRRWGLGRGVVLGEGGLFGERLHQFCIWQGKVCKKNSSVSLEWHWKDIDLHWQTGSAY